MSIFFTSDLHFNHNKDFIYKPRGFSSIEEHDETIIKNWNNDVGENDDVYVIGDLMMGTDLDLVIAKISRLNGRIHIIIGNHDTDRKCETYLKCPNVVSCKYADIVKIGKWRVYLSHRPTIMTTDITDKTSDLKSLCCHGHSHSDDPFEYIRYGCYNVALDAHGNRPVNFENIKEEFREKVQEVRSLAEKSKMRYRIKAIGTNLYYNEDYNVLTEQFGTIYETKDKAEEKLSYAKRYASSTEYEYEIEKM